MSPGSSTVFQTWRPHQESPVGVAWSPQGDLLATGAGGDAARIWRMPLRDNPIAAEKSSGVRTLAWNARGTLLAGLQDGKRVRVWDAGGRLKSTLALEGIEPVCLAWSPKGNKLAVGENTGTVRIWDTVTWKPLPRASWIVRGDASNQPYDLSWNPDGARLAIFGDSLEILDTATGRHTLIDQSSYRYDSPIWSADGQMLVGNGWEDVWVWRFGPRVERMRLDGGAQALTWSGPLKLMGLREDQLLTWDLSLGRWEPVRKP